MTDKCTSPERAHDPHDLANRMFSLAEMADRDMVLGWAKEASELLNAHASLTKKVERLEELPSLVPTTWLDPIFVGDNAVDTSKCDGQQVEALLLAIKKRLSDALLESE